jgi:metal-responsive CopG/Arc/MetJ family transcriptional regulator
MAQHRAHIVLPEDLLAQIDELVGFRGRSQFFTELARREIHRLRLLRLLEDEKPGWDLTRHPELNEGTAAWIDSLRREDEKIDSGKRSR